MRIESEPKDCLVLSNRCRVRCTRLSWANPDGSGNVLVIGAGGIGLCLAFALTTGNNPFSSTSLILARASRGIEAVPFQTVTQYRGPMGSMTSFSMLLVQRPGSTRRADSYVAEELSAR